MKAIFALALLAPNMARAQPSAAPPSPSIVPEQTGGQSADNSKDPTTAFMLSFGTTVAGAGMFLLSASRDGAAAKISGGVGAVAALLGPTVGHVYAERTWNAGLGIRLASVGGMALGAVAYAGGSCTSHGIDTCTSVDSTREAGTILFGASVGAYLIGTLVEIATASSAAREHNHEHHLDATLTFAPVQARNGLAPSLLLVGRF